MPKESKPYILFVDNEKFVWEQPTITGAQLRTLASIPQNVQIFLHVPGKPDAEILDTTVVDLSKENRPEKFSTQSAGSQAG